MKQKAIIFDIDGTLANCNHRRHFVEGKTKSFDKFYEAMGDDEVNEWCVELIKMVYANKIVPILVSGRPEKYRKITQKWLLETAKIPGYMKIKLYMRPEEKPYAPDTEVKGEIYEKYIKEKFDILFTIDDRKKMVAYWRSIGLVCLACAEGEY
jgi:FMN phosphatase YigB (HAD superfamily)